MVVVQCDASYRRLIGEGEVMWRGSSVVGTDVLSVPVSYMSTGLLTQYLHLSAGLRRQIWLL